MSQFHPPHNQSLTGKVVVVTGGATGIGAALVRLCHAAGAHVFFGDVQDLEAITLEQELSTGSDSQTVKYIRCDVTLYADNLHLFDTAYRTAGRIDHAVSNAGIGEQGNIVSPDLTLESVREAPDRSDKVVDVNLKGPIYFARLASVYLRQPDVNTNHVSETLDKSLTFTSSVGGFREDPGLYVYCATKHGVLGLMRSLRGHLIKSEPDAIRTNAICPWATLTRMFAGVEQAWADAGLPSNKPEDVARIMLGVICDGKLNGEAVYIEGGRGWKIEENKTKLRPQWLGEKQTKDLDEGTRVLGGGEGWTAGQ